MTYESIVDKRKSFELNKPGLINQSSLRFDEECYLDPWGKWQNSLKASILVIGQDWGNVKYYEDNLGFDNPNNPTCKNLKTLFMSLGIDIGEPNNSTKDLRLHFANIISFLRTGKMQGGLPLILNQSDINEYGKMFLNPLINLVQPKI